LAEAEREFEEKVEAKRRRGSAKDYPDPAKRDRKKPKPPLLLRVLAWCGVILFCFVVGYAGTGYMVKKIGLDKPWPLQGDDISPPINEEVPESVARFDMQKETFSVFYPKDGELRSENVEVVARTLEDNIQEAVQGVFRLGAMREDVSVLHVFRDVDTVYLNLSSHFLDVLNEYGENGGTLLITGIARTMSDNFSLTKVRFLVDSRVVSSGAPVDLSAVWQLQR
jgi:hypothetical protein